MLVGRIRVRDREFARRAEVFRPVTLSAPPMNHQSYIHSGGLPSIRTSQISTSIPIQVNSQHHISYQHLDDNIINTIRNLGAEMWSPTHVQVTVIRARNIKTKGKSGTNDAYVSIRLGKEKYQTSVKERSQDPAWNEKCQFALSEKDVEVRLKVYHRNLLGKDDLLGSAHIRLDQIDVHERTRNRWYPLQGKDSEGSSDSSPSLGELECVVFFYVENLTGSHLNLSKIDKTKRLSLKRLSSKNNDDKAPFKWPGRSGSLLDVSPHDKLRSISFHEIKEDSLKEEDNNNNLGGSIEDCDSMRDSISDSTYTSDNRKDSSTCDDDVIGDDLNKSTDRKQKKGSLLSRISSSKHKNNRLQKMGAMSQSTLGINTAPSGSPSSEKRENFMKSIPFMKKNLFHKEAKYKNPQDEPKSPESLSENHHDTEIGDKTDVIAEFERDNKADKFQGSIAESSKANRENLKLNLGKNSSANKSESDGNELSTNKSKTKRRAPQPSELYANQMNGDKNGENPNSNSGSNKQSARTNPSTTEISAGKGSLPPSKPPKSGRASRDESLQGGGSGSSSRSNSPPVININYRRQTSTAPQEVNGSNKAVTKSEASPHDDDDKKLISRLTQTQLENDEEELSLETLLEFYSYSRNDLIRMVTNQKKSIQKKDSHISDLETYIDNLVVKVIDLQPKLLLTHNDSGSESPGFMTPSSSRTAFTLPRMTSTPRSEVTSPRSKPQGPFFEKLRRSSSGRISSDKLKNPFKAIKDVLK